MTTEVVVVKKRKSAVSVAAMPASNTKPKRVVSPQMIEAEKVAKQAAYLKQQKAEQQTARIRRYEKARKMLVVMSEKWPAVFGPDAPTVPLKIAIRQEIIAALPDHTPTEVRKGVELYFYLVRFKYLKALIAGGPRFDLNGQECGVVTEEQQGRALTELERLKGKGELQLNRTEPNITEPNRT